MLTEKLLAVLATARRINRPAKAERLVSCPECGRLEWRTMGDIAATDGALLRALREIPTCTGCGGCMLVEAVEVVITAVRNEAVIQLLGCSSTRSGDFNNPAAVRVELKPRPAWREVEDGFWPAAAPRPGYAVPGSGGIAKYDHLLACSR